MGTEILYASGLAMCVLAIGGSVSLGEVIFINVTVSLFAGLMPIPGGIGVTEAGLDGLLPHRGRCPRRHRHLGRTSLPPDQLLPPADLGLRLPQVVGEARLPLSILRFSEYLQRMK